MFKDNIAYQTLNLKKGEFLFRQGASVDRLFFLEKGRVKLVRNTIEGQPLVIHIAYSQETFAEASLFSDEYHCNAICDSLSTVLSFSKDEVLVYLKSHPKYTIELLKINTAQVRDLRLLNEIKSINSAYDRVWAFLLSEVNQESKLHFSYSLKDMAQKLGLAHETFYRTLKILEQEGRIIRQEQVIKLV
ncbi:transcriptional regulator, Crp/Fnr family [uncultured Gammaproteobacteria bacterium]|jgi:CRP-like cAMP-binding protein|nr:transcriptional regulator, Crp/Fnr family [uncultured Gammaproteobacteria bacterium]CAC9449896.1 transcriptional regulator, Crp/Fnr family [uncultured Gammaproteobacteria bacterium]CAC9452303.1 transcriptional regulator, Crp/Fnr family [uncultured Gammaproteobacteria bacterium]VVH65382.1 transcriptional regulator, Crp/Fnr family [uncultured Gammaproteobacteria bacterium]